MREELVRKVFAAYNAHEADAWAALMTADGTFTSAYWGIDGRTYVGDQGLREYFEEMGDQWDEYSMDIVRIEQAGDLAVAVATLHATEPETHVEVAPEVALIFEFEGELISSVVTFANVDDALARL
ncbi:MAG TPA: nuclear transport factor 2 family protein [Baekduia sp.]|nr:nuclear transport factor 2 family protein [Baekduia sp.]